MLDELIEAIHSYDSRLELDSVPPASPEQLQTLQDRSKHLLGCTFPADYINFLSMMDGCMVSSLTVSGSHRRQTHLTASGGLRRQAFLSPPDPKTSYWIPDAVDFARRMQVERAPGFDDGLVLAYGPALRGWDPTESSWFMCLEDGDRVRNYDCFEELLADALYESNLDVRHIMPPEFEFSSLDADDHAVFGSRGAI